MFILLKIPQLFSPPIVPAFHPPLYDFRFDLRLSLSLPDVQPANAAVMVYFPGGAFKFGGASNPNYAGVSLAASSDVIIVTVGYRVSVFGVFSTGEKL